MDLVATLEEAAQWEQKDLGKFQLLDLAVILTYTPVLFHRTVCENERGCYI